MLYQNSYEMENIMKKVKSMLLWICTIFLLILTLGSFASGDIFSGILMLLASITSCPILITKLQKIGKMPKKRLWIPMVCILFFGSLFTASPAPVSESQPAAIVESTATAESAADNVALSTEMDSECESEEPSTETVSDEISTEISPTIIETELEVTADTDTESADSETVTESSDIHETTSDSSELSVHFIDVGQGDATLIICDGEAMLIDAGDNNKGTKIQSYLTKQGVKSLKYVIGTHPDADHIGGLDVILYKFDCQTIIMPDEKKDTATYRDVIDTMKNKLYKNTLPVVGTSYDLGGAQFTIISPSKKYSESNDNSVAILLTHGENKFIFTGDAEEAESDMLKTGISLDADVYKVGHHGSKTASSKNFLNKVTPTYAVISCGIDNSYGHPHAETLNNLRAMGVRVFRTDEQGTIVASSDGTKITWNCSPSDSWKAGEPTGSASNETVSNSKTVSSEPAPAIDEKPDATESVAPAVPTPTPVEPAAPEITYVCNKNTKKFHYPRCSSAGDIKPSNRLESTATRDELIAQGYVPCKRCKP